MKAQAIVVREPGQVRLEQVTTPEPMANDVVVRVTHSWISPGTEGSFIRGERVDGETARQPGDPLPFPLVPGYQKIGVAEWVGGNVHDIAVGETVFAAMSLIDGMVFGAGGHVSPAVTPRAGIWKLPPGMDPLAFSGLVLTQVGYNCGTRPTLAPGDAALVIGDGLVGQWAAQTLAQRGATVLLAGRHDQRLGHFAGATVNTAQHDLAAAARVAAPYGLQVVVDTVGSLHSIAQLLPLMRHDSHLVSAGFYKDDSTLAIQALRPAEITLHAPSGWTTPRMNATRDLIAAGALHTLPLITHRFPIGAAREAFAVALNDRAALGVVLEWEEEQP